MNKKLLWTFSFFKFWMIHQKNLVPSFCARGNSVNFCCYFPTCVCVCISTSFQVLRVRLLHCFRYAEEGIPPYEVHKDTKILCSIKAFFQSIFNQPNAALSLAVALCIIKLVNHCALIGQGPLPWHYINSVCPFIIYLAHHNKSLVLWTLNLFSWSLVLNSID